MGVLDSVTSIAGQAKNVTLPGIVAASAFAIIAWPPRSIDTFTVPRARVLQVHLQDPWPSPSLFSSDDPLYRFLAEGQPACKPGVRAELKGDANTVREVKDAAVKNQLVLEAVHQTYLECENAEKALNIEDDVLLTYANELLKQRTTERAAILDKAQTYQLQLSPVAGSLTQQLKDKDREIQSIQVAALKYGQTKQERQYRIDELQRQDNEVQALLGEPGRLRPKQHFDDILNGLSNHVIGFAVLVIAWGLLLAPLNRAAFNLLYSDGFDGLWDLFREDRVNDPGLQTVRLMNKPYSPGPDNAFAKLMFVTAVALLICFWTQLANSLHMAAVFAARRDTQITERNHTSRPATDYQDGCQKIPSVVCNDGTCIPAMFDCVPGVAGVPDAANGRKAHEQSEAPLYGRPGKVIDNGEKRPQILTPRPGPAAQYNEPSVDYSGFRKPVPLTAASEYPTFLRCFAVSICAIWIGMYWPKVVVDYRSFRPPGSDDPAPPLNAKGNTTGTSPPDRASRLAPKKRTGSSLRSNLYDFLWFKSPARPVRLAQLRHEVLERNSALDDLFALEQERMPEPLSGHSHGEAPAGSAQSQEQHAHDREAAKPACPGKKDKQTGDEQKGNTAAGTLTCLKELAQQWPKLSQPEYAIGMQMIARSDYDALESSFESDSQLSAGLFLPLMLLVWALLYGGVFAIPSWLLLVALLFGQSVLLFAAVDLRHKFETGIDNLIAGSFMKRCSKKSDSALDAGKATADMITAALTNAKIMRRTKLAILPGAPQESCDDPTTKCHGDGNKSDTELTIVPGVSPEPTGTDKKPAKEDTTKTDNGSPEDES